MGLDILKREPAAGPVPSQNAVENRDQHKRCQLAVLAFELSGALPCFDDLLQSRLIGPAQIQRQLNQVTQQQAQMQQQQQGAVLTGQIGWSQRGNPRFGIYLNHYPGMSVLGRR